MSRLQTLFYYVGGGSNPTPSFICLDVVEDFIFFISIARCSCTDTEYLFC